MERALDCYSFDLDVNSALERMTENETEAMILHELGEGLAGEKLGNEWHKMITAFSRSKAEIMIRAVRDILADCLSTLPALLAANNTASLHFYFANFSGMRKHLFPEAMTAYQGWVAEKDIGVLHKLVDEGQRRWLDTAHALLALYREKGLDAAAAIEHLLEPGTETVACCQPKTALNP
jgi:hypothetical protein